MIEVVARTEVGVEIDIDGRRIELSWRWLRDHACDPCSYNARTEQRLVSLGAVVSAGPGETLVENGGRSLVVRWSDGSGAELGADFLTSVADPDTMYGSLGVPAIPWSGKELAERLVHLPYGELVETDTVLAHALASLWEDGIAVVEAVPLDLAAARTPGLRRRTTHRRRIRQPRGSREHVTARVGRPDASPGPGLRRRSPRRPRNLPSADGQAGIGLLYMGVHTFGRAGGRIEATWTPVGCEFQRRAPWR